MKTGFVSILAVVLSLGAHSAMAEVTSSLDKESGLKKWIVSEGGFHLEMIQRLPDQTRGFFMGREFSPAVANDIATACVFQLIGRNTADGVTDKTNSIAVDLAHWRVRHDDGQITGIKLKEQWDKQWSAQQASKAARIAFRWATFPSQQAFDPGDYNWGMASLGPAPGQVIDVEIVWSEKGERRSQWVTAVECPNDR